MPELFNKLFNRFNAYQDDIDYEDDYEHVEDEEIYESEEPAEETEEPRPAGPFRRSQNKVVDFKSTPGQAQVVIMQPADIDAAQQACDYIRAGKTVICNIEKVDPKVAQRVIDFITGSAYALDGKVMPVSSVIFVVAPRNTSLVEGGIVNQSMDYVKQTASSH